MNEMLKEMNGMLSEIEAAIRTPGLKWTKRAVDGGLVAYNVATPEWDLQVIEKDGAAMGAASNTKRGTIVKLTEPLLALAMGTTGNAAP